MRLVIFFLVFMWVTMGCRAVEVVDDAVNQSSDDQNVVAYPRLAQMLQKFNHSEVFFNYTKYKATREGKEVGRATREYTDSGDIKKFVRMAQKEEEAEVSHHLTSVYTYDDKNRLSEKRLYDDEAQAELVQEVQYAYQGDGSRLESYVQTNYKDKAKSRQETVELDKHGRTVKTTTEGYKDGAKTYTEVEECRYKDETYFANRDCTTTRDGKKVEERKEDYESRKITETSFDDDHPDGKVTLVEEYSDDDRHWGILETKRVRKYLKLTSTAEKVCEVSANEYKCTEKTKREDDSISNELETVHKIKYMRVSVADYVVDHPFMQLQSRRSTSFSRSLGSPDLPTSKTEILYDISDQFVVTKRKTTRSQIFKDSSKDKTTEDETVFTYDKGGERLIKVEAKRLKGEGVPTVSGLSDHFSSITLIEYEYAE